MKSGLSFLESWYSGFCDGKWEHEFGVNITTIDNPGWLVDIDLKGTPMCGKAFEKVNIKESETEWLRCWIDNTVFKIACGPNVLSKGVDLFQKWVSESGYGPKA